MGVGGSSVRSGFLSVAWFCGGGRGALGHDGVGRREMLREAERREACVLGGGWGMAYTQKAALLLCLSAPRV